MKQIDNILNHVLYQKEMEKIERLERERIYCGHGLEHQLDVARVAYILALEEKREIPRYVIYGMALLHDLGRGMQYEEGVPHEQASVFLATEILPECGYTKTETDLILKVIGNHRKEINCQGKAQESIEETLSRLLYMADKRSRNCVTCQAKESCHWAEEKKNNNIFR